MNRYSIVQRVGLATRTILLGIAGCVGTFAYAIPAIDDFERLSTTGGMFLTAFVFCCVCLAAWCFSIRLAFLAFRGVRVSIVEDGRPSGT